MFSNTKENPLLALDVYKMGHMEQYAPGVTSVYSYLQARQGDRLWDKTVFFGLQYYLKEYLSTKLEPWMADEFLLYREAILDMPNSQDVQNKIHSLAKLGYWPLHIKAVPEGTKIPVQNVLMTLTSTIDDFHWTPGYIESLLLKAWYTTTVCSHSRKYRELVDVYFDETVDAEQDFLRDFTVHDFGYRGDASEEGAAISGVAHLVNFIGSDTVPALPCAMKYYGASLKGTMMSVPASEHSVMCSFGKEDELAAFKHMIALYPTGIVSIVSDTFNIYRVLTEFAEKLKPLILARNGKVVFRPDSGNPEHIICGNPDAPEGSPEWLGAIRLLDKMFGSEVNKKGFRVLNPKVGLIYGDGMYYERYERTLKRLKEMGYAASNLVIGVGGILRNHSRDTFGFAIKGTEVIKNGVDVEIEKDPITDSKKKSHKGLLRLDYEVGSHFTTVDRVSREEEKKGYLQSVFLNGKLLKDYDLKFIRERSRL